MSVWLFVIILLLFAFLGAPLFTIIAAIGLYAFTSADIDTSALIIDLYKIADTPTLIAIPLFTFAGYLLAEVKLRSVSSILPRPLWLDAGRTCHRRSGHLCDVHGIHGASGVTIVALGGLLYPILLKEKYPEQFSLGLVTASGSIGLLFPPVFRSFFTDLSPTSALTSFLSPG